MKPFSYEEYSFIINNIKQHIPLLDYAELTTNTNKFCIIRHDVEFSVDRAFNLAKIEHENLNINSSYFFQLRNNSYNLFSQKNIELIIKIFDMGHKIGLHVHIGNLGNLTNEKQVKNYILNDIKIMSKCLKIKIDRFSYHRPSNQILSMNLKLDGIINTYDKLYFQHYQEKRPDKLDVYYLSDSQHRWDYGHPIELIKQGIKKMQILMHPYSWSEEGFPSNKNFTKLLDEKMIEMKNTIRNECKHFPL